MVILAKIVFFFFLVSVGVGSDGDDGNGAIYLNHRALPHTKNDR